MKLFQSKAYKVIIGFVYGWGATAVIIGALFKIMHFPGAGIVLTVGMLVEAFIFFMSAFEPALEHYDWSRVFPVLGKSEAEWEKEGRQASPMPLGVMPSAVPQQADPVAFSGDMGGLGAEDFSKLKAGITKITESADRFAEIINQTPDMAQKMSKVSDSFDELGLRTQEISEQMSNVNKNVGALNALYELQIQGTKDYLESFRGVQGDMGEMLENVSLSLDSTKLFKQEAQQLVNNVHSLNAVYGNMLSVVNNN